MTTLKTLALAAFMALSPVIHMSSLNNAHAAEPAPGEIIMLNVNGLVCDFCAESVRKIFGKEEAVQKVHVDLANGKVRVDLKPGKSMDDAALEKLIRKSGYALVSIDRNVAK